MTEYIEREALIKRLEASPLIKNYLIMRGSQNLINGIFDLIKRQPTADVVEVRHGEWLLESRIHKMPDDVDEEFYVECPFCQRTFYVPFEFEEEKMLTYAKEKYPYCNCGAKMDGKDK